MTGPPDPSGPPAAHWLLLQAAVSGTIMSGIRPVASYRALELGADATGIGTLAASFSIGTLVFALPMGRLIDRTGAARVLIVAVAAVPVSVAAIGAVSAEWTLWLVCGVFGLAHLAGLVCLQALAAAGRTGVGMDRSFGNLTAAISTGQLLGPAIALAVPAALPAHALPWSEASSGALILSLMALIGVPLALFQLRHSTRPKREPNQPTILGSATLVRIPGVPAALAASGVVLASVELLSAYLPMWAEERGISAGQVALLLMVRALVMIVSRIGVARVVSRLGRRIVLGVSMLIGTTGFCLLPLVGFGGAMVTMIALGIGLGIAQPLTLAWVASRAPGTQRGAALSLRMISNRLFQTVVPASVGVAAPLLSAIGIPGVSGRAFLAAAGLMAATSCVVLATPMRELRPEKDPDPDT